MPGNRDWKASPRSKDGGIGSRITRQNGTAPAFWSIKGESPEEKAHAMGVVAANAREREGMTEAEDTRDLLEYLGLIQPPKKPRKKKAPPADEAE